MNTMLFFYSVGLTVLVGFSVQSTNLHECIDNKDSKQALDIIRHTKLSDDLNELKDGYTPLHRAIKNNMEDVASALIKAKADKNAISLDHESPAFLALKLDRFSILKSLIKAGAIIESDSLLKLLSRVQKEIPALEILKAEPSFIASMNVMLRHEITRACMPYLYPLFAKDEEFFSTLSIIFQKRIITDWQVSQIIHAQINADFPDGIPSKLTLQWISALLNEMNASGSLRYQLWYSLKQKWDKTQKREHRSSKTLPPTLADYKRFLDDIDVMTIAQALTDHDVRTMKQLTPKQVRLWLKNKNLSVVIRDLLAAHHKVSNFFAYYIVSESDPALRVKRIKRMARLAKELEVMNNFWGLSQVVSGLTRSEVTRLFEGDKKFEELAFLQQKSQFLSAGNAQDYDQKIAKLPPNEPRILLVTHNLDKLDRTFKNSPTEKILDWFVALGKISSELFSMKRNMFYPWASDKVAAEIFDEVRHIPDDILREYSDMQEPWTMRDIKREPPSTPMGEWSSLDLFSFTDHMDNKGLKKKLLEEGIWDGPALMSLFHELNQDSSLKVVAEAMRDLLKKEPL